MAKLPHGITQAETVPLKVGTRQHQHQQHQAA